MFAHHDGVDVRGLDIEPLGQVYLEPEAVEKRAGRKHSVVAGQLASDLGQRVRWIGDNHEHRCGGSVDDLGNDVGVNQPVFGA